MSTGGDAATTRRRRVAARASWCLPWLGLAEVPGYRVVRDGGWSLWFHRSVWHPEWWPQVEASRRDMRDVIRASRHAQTAILDLSAGADTLRAYFKLYRPANRTARAKDLLRWSRALRSLRMSQELAADGFGVPQVLAAGEERRRGVLQQAFLLTAEVVAFPLMRVSEALAQEPVGGRLALKRALLLAVGREVGRFHARGYVHGDLVVTNVMVRWQPCLAVFFLDHDRTRLGWARVRARRQRRNLVQLNRHHLAGVSNGDRMRVLSAYAKVRGWSRERMRREVRWMARKTRTARASMPGFARAVPGAPRS